jgi:peptidoglycan/xylan/chitin deacetylase (PgdA/CDA1 family)
VWRLVRAGRRLVYWSLASDDHILTPGQVAERCIRARPRDVILLHDRKPHTRQALPAVLDALAAKGLKTVTLAEAEVP